MTIETEVAALTTATTALLYAVNVRKTSLDTAEANAAASAAEALSRKTDADTAAAAAAASQVTAATDAATATTKAAEAAASAAAASSAVLGQTTSKLVLDVIDQSVFASTTLVDAVIYDTSKDSDGGAWRKRCQDKSWYQETIYGKWLGSGSSEAVARAISGATTNDYYYDTTAAKFYALNAGAGRTEVFRGNVREFPARVLITAESARVVIWDLTQPGCPMWRMYTKSGAYGFWASDAASCTSVAAINGALLIGLAGSGTLSNNGLRRVSFTQDSISKYSDSSVTGGVLACSAASPISTNTFTAPLPQLVHNTVNDVAITVLPDAPIDPATGLPVPTIAVATDGGVSEIQNTGSVTNYGTSNKWWRVAYFGTDYLFAQRGTSGGVSRYGVFDRITRIAGTITQYVAPTPQPVPGADGTPGLCVSAKRVFDGSDTGLSTLFENPASPALGMVAYSTIAYASGWLPGDIRGAFITAADGVTETITASGELVTNGTFDTDTTGWTALATSDFSVTAGQVSVTNNGTVAGKAYQAIPTVVGKTYLVRASLVSISTGFGRISWQDTVPTAEQSVGITGLNSAVPAVASVSFVATATTTYLYFGNRNDPDAVSVWDNISVKLAVADRSVKNNGLVINGSLSKAPVAAGAGLCALSGFSAANYLEQPYSANLDFGTGDFCVMFWFKTATSAVDETLFDRASASGSGIHIRLGVDSLPKMYVTDDNYVTTDLVAGVSAVDDSQWRIGFFGRSGGNFLLALNAGAATSTPVVNANTSLSNANAVARVGLRNNGAYPAVNTAITFVRSAAMWPSDDQRRLIYETERKLFEPGAQCAIAGTSNVITALAYDDETDLLHVGTSWGRSAFQGLLRVASEATPVGSIKALAASGGAIAQAGAASADIYVPAYSLREEMERLDDAARALGSRPVFHEFDAITSQVDFVVPAGFKAIAVYSAGALKRVGSTKDYTILNDGFRETVRFAVAPGNGVWVSIMTVRSN